MVDEVSRFLAPGFPVVPAPFLSLDPVHGMAFGPCTWNGLWTLYMEWPLDPVHGMAFGPSTWNGLWTLYMEWPLDPLHGMAFGPSTWNGLWTLYMEWPLDPLHGMAFGPSTWNGLPLPLRQKPSLDSFKSNPKIVFQNNRPAMFSIPRCCLRPPQGFCLLSV